MTSLYRAMWVDRVTGDQSDRVGLARECLSQWALDDPDTGSLADGVTEKVRTQGVHGVDMATTRTVQIVSAESDGGESGFRAVVQDTPPAERKDQTVWTVEVRVLATEDGIHTLVELGMEADDPTKRVAVGRPRLVDELLAFAEEPALGGSAIASSVLDVDAAGVGQLIDHLRDPERTLPVIVFTEPTGRETHNWRDLAERTFTRARAVTAVVRMNGDAVTSFRSALGDLAVWGGGIRTYAPAPLDSSADAWRHRYIPWSRVQGMQHSTVDRLVLTVAALSARRRIPASLSGLASPLSTNSSAIDLVELERGWQSELDQERDERAQVEQQLAQAQGHLARLEERLRGRGLHELFWEAHDAAQDELPDAVQTVSDAIIEAQIHLSDWISLPDSAPKELDGVDTAPNAVAWGNTAWRGLRALAQYSRDRMDGFDGGFWDWCQRSGHPLAWPATSKKLAMRESESVMNNKSMRRSREFGIDPAVCESGRVVMQAHLKISEGGGDLAPRIYFHDDTMGETKRVHVGFVGPHHLVPNTKS